MTKQNPSNSNEGKGNTPDPKRVRNPNEDEVDESSMESFPASDAPSWSGTTSTEPAAGSAKHKNGEQSKSSSKDDASKNRG